MDFVLQPASRHNMTEAIKHPLMIFQCETLMCDFLPFDEPESVSPQPTNLLTTLAWWMDYGFVWACCFHT